MIKNLKIGGFTWTVEENADTANESNSFGSTHTKSLKLFLDPMPPKQKREQCLLHEIMHALFWQTGLEHRMKDVKGITEEEIIHALSNGLYQVLTDNFGLKILED